MAAPTDPAPRKKKGAGTTVAVWALLAMLVLGLGGFGVTNYGGGVRSIGSVGAADIDVNDYARALQQELSAFGAQIGQPVTLSMAQSLGLDRKVLQDIVSRTALEAEAERIGISAGDAVIAREVTRMEAFQGTAGSFDRETYRFALSQSNLTEAEFEATLRRDVARSILQSAVAGGFEAPPALTDRLAAWVGERRSFSLLRLTEADLAAPVPAPSETDLAAYHAANIATFTRPEARRITYAVLLPETLAAEMPLEDAALRTAYDERLAEFVQPERRLVERLVFPTADEAATAKARIDAGAAFDALVAERGLKLTDIDLGDVAKGDLGAAGDAVFALTEPGVAGPFDSDLGPALFRMNGVLAAQETTFAEAEPVLRAELSQDAARREIAARLESVDDQLAGGATLEEIAGVEGMRLATFDYVPGGENADPIAGYTNFRDAADVVTEDDFPKSIVLADGGLLALRLDAVVPPVPLPLAEVTDRVAEAWRADAVASALAARAAEITAAVVDGAPLGPESAVAVTPSIARDGFVEGAPETLLPAVFAMASGEVRVIEGPDYTGVVRLDTITPADPASPDAIALREAIAAQASQGIAQDAFSAFSAALGSAAGITLDQGAIDAVHAQFN